MSTFATVYTTMSFSEAGFLRMALVDHGIPCTIENQGGAAYAIGIPTTAIPLTLSVPEAHGETARQIIAAARRAVAEAPSTPMLPMQKVPCSCGKTLEVPEGSVEQSIECPFCGTSVLVPGEHVAPAGEIITVLWAGQVVGTIRSERCDPPEVRGPWETGDEARAHEFLIELWAGRELDVELRRSEGDPLRGCARMPADSEELVVRLQA